MLLHICNNSFIKSNIKTFTQTENLRLYGQGRSSLWKIPYSTPKRYKVKLSYYFSLHAVVYVLEVTSRPKALSLSEADKFNNYRVR